MLLWFFLDSRPACTLLEPQLYGRFSPAMSAWFVFTHILMDLLFRLGAWTMKIRNSLKSAKIRDKNCRIVRRRGRVYIINKKNPRLKARQG